MFFPEALLNSPMFGIGLTIIVYVFCELIVNRFELNIIPPFVLACPIIMGIIYFQSPHITYEQYAAGANFINFLLGPATVALALPLYRNRQTLKNNLAVIVSGVVVATVIGIVSIFVCGKLFGASEPGSAFSDSQISNNAYCHGYFQCHWRYTILNRCLCYFYRYVWFYLQS